MVCPQPKVDCFSHYCADQYLAEDLGRTSAELSLYYYIAMFFLLLCPANFSHLGLFGPPIPIFLMQGDWRVLPGFTLSL